MFTLLSSKTSPYGRKVRLVVDILGLENQMVLQHASTVDAADPLREINPLGKIPALVPEDGVPIYDSRVIIDYLESFYGDGNIIPRDPKERYRQLTLATLAEGVNDALVLITYEKRFRSPEQASQIWLDHQQGKVQRGLQEICNHLDEYESPNIASLTLACALGYADWRKQLDWRSQFPQLETWLIEFAKNTPEWERTIAPTEMLQQEVKQI